MSWPQAFAIVGVAASFAVMAWALAWMTVHTERDDFGLSKGDVWTVDMRPTKKADSPAPRPPRES